LEPIVAPGLIKTTDERETTKDKNNILKSFGNIRIKESMDNGKKLMIKIIHFVKNKS